MVAFITENIPRDIVIYLFPKELVISVIIILCKTSVQSKTKILLSAALCDQVFNASHS